MSKTIKFLLCETHSSPDLREIIQYVESLNLADRQRTIRGYDTRLERVKEETVEFFDGGKSEKRGAYILDFCKRYEAGPGLAFDNDPLEGFNFESPDKKETGSYGSNTAVLYEPISKYAVVQYNHNGSRFNSMAEYLTEIFPNMQDKVRFRLAIDRDIQAKLNEMERGFSFEFSYIPKLITPNTLDELAIIKTLEEAQNRFAGTGKIEIKWSKDPHGKGELAGVTNIAKEFLNYFASNDDEQVIKKAKIKGASSIDDSVDEIDLISQKIAKEYNAPVPKRGLFTLPDRSQLLKDSFKHFTQTHKLVNMLGVEE